MRYALCTLRNGFTLRHALCAMRYAILIKPLPALEFRGGKNCSGYRF